MGLIPSYVPRQATCSPKVGRSIHYRRVRNCSYDLLLAKTSNSTRLDVYIIICGMRHNHGWVQSTLPREVVLPGPGAYLPRPRGGAPIMHEPLPPVYQQPTIENPLLTLPTLFFRSLPPWSSHWSWSWADPSWRFLALLPCQHSACFPLFLSLGCEQTGGRNN